MQLIENITLFGLSILNATQEAALKLLFDAKTPQTIGFLNAHCVNVAAKRPDYRWSLAKFTVLLPDGSGVDIAARLQGDRLKENLNGTDLFLPLMRKAAETGKSIFFLGSAPGVAERAAAQAQLMVPGLSVAGVDHGYFAQQETPKILNQINESGADIVLVAMGVPLQENFVAEHRHKLKAQLVFAVGAQFDFWSGRVKRAPLFLRAFGFEWMWRFLVEPRRMFGRYVLGNPAFLARAVYQAFAKVDAATWRHRLIDTPLALAGLIALIPLFLAISLIIRLGSEGPALFRQTRIGKNGIPFTLYKFRSMRPNAEAELAKVKHLSSRDGICFKAKDDPRVTRIGKILRRFSIDELPQIINIVKGDMAIVGPRPALPREVAAYPQRALGRLAVRPGLTGLWQVSGRADIGFDAMIGMDLAYARAKSLLPNLILLSLTLRAVLTGRGAH